MNNKDTDQTAWMLRLVCAFVVRDPQRQVFSHRGPYPNLCYEEVSCKGTALNLPDEMVGLVNSTTASASGEGLIFASSSSSSSSP